MISCYDSLSLDNGFVCQLQKIKCLFADKVFANYMEIRYGVKSCCLEQINLLQISDLKDLMEYIYTLDLSLFSKNTYLNAIQIENQIQSMVGNNCVPEFAKETLEICNISNLIEKINSL